MSTLAARIEHYIQKLLEREEGRIRIQRSKIASRFDCAPSQVSYVLQTRFSPEKGYIVESQRGGGGYIEIASIEEGSGHDLLSAVYEYARGGMSQKQGLDILHRLWREKFLTQREYALLANIIKRETLMVSLPKRDRLRGRVIQAAVEKLYRIAQEEGS